MPFDSKKYPANWKAFSLEIRNGRAKGKCEECSVENYAVGARDRFGKFHTEDAIYSMNSDVGMDLFSHKFDTKMTKIILTVAHLDHEGGICDCYARTGMKCTIPEHVLSLCQKCHLALDMPKHIANRRETIATRNDAARPLLGENIAMEQQSTSPHAPTSNAATSRVRCIGTCWRSVMRSKGRRRRFYVGF